MARLEQHKAWDATPHNGEHIRQVVRDPEPRWHQNRPLFPPEPSFQFQAEVLGHKLSRLG